MGRAWFRLAGEQAMQMRCSVAPFAGDSKLPFQIVRFHSIDGEEVSIVAAEKTMPFAIAGEDGMRAPVEKAHFCDPVFLVDCIEVSIITAHVDDPRCDTGRRYHFAASMKGPLNPLEFWVFRFQRRYRNGKGRLETSARPAPSR